jgi:C-terminal processing protease CtpA/Prc
MVGEGSPADAAGLQQHDILLFSDDTQLLTNADLVAAVENAGQNSKPVSLTVMRGGQEIGIEVTPAERSTQPMAGRLPRMPDLGLGGGFGLGQLGGDFGDFEIESFGPNEVGVDFEQAIEGLRQQMQRARERQQQLFDRMQQR